MTWLFGLAGAGVWTAYLAGGLLVAKACAGGSGKFIHVIYWVLPIVVGIFCASAFSAMAAYSKVALGFEGWLLLLVALALFGYGFQWILRIYIFKCRACGTTHSTYRVAWRRGVFTCPNCKRQYFKGVMGPA
jgi:hypothetical protein